MKITKAQLRKIIKEELKEAAEDPRAPSPKSHEYPDAGSNFRRAVMNMVLQQVDLSVPPGKREQLINDIQLAFDNAGIGGPISRVEQDSPRYETSAEADLAKFQKDRFGKKGNHASTVMADYKSDY